MERGEELDYSVNALIPVLKILIIERIYLSMLSLSLNSVILGILGNRSLTVC
jgi:hypothetical protein